MIPLILVVGVAGAMLMAVGGIVTMQTAYVLVILAIGVMTLVSAIERASK